MTRQLLDALSVHSRPIKPTDLTLYTHGGYMYSSAEEVAMSKTLSFRVPAMHCENCERAIRGEVARVAGVEAVEVDLDAKLVTVRGDAVSDEAVREAIDEAGYEVA